MKGKAAKSWSEITRIGNVEALNDPPSPFVLWRVNPQGRGGG